MRIVPKRVVKLQTDASSFQTATHHGSGSNREAFLKSSVGTIRPSTERCEKCRNGRGQFASCIVVPGFFKGSCTNCVWGKGLESERFQTIAAYNDWTEHGRQRQRKKDEREIQI